MTHADHIYFGKHLGGNIQTLPNTVFAFKKAFKLPISLEQKKISQAFQTATHKWLQAVWLDMLLVCIQNT